MSPADPLLDGLNPAQRDAVTSDPSCCTLVLAGAGSGKTRALTHRFAWLAHTQGIPPREIMAVTFTNKAAAEMRERIEHLLGGAPALPWIGTFHALCRRMLLRFPAEAGLPENFQILDRDDQKALVRQVLRDMDRPRKQRDVADAIRWISLRKRDGQRARHIEPMSRGEEVYIKVMEQYENRCQNSGMVDFDELLAPAADVAAGSEGLLFLPYLTGERTPHPDPFARGAFVGLTVRHGLAHMTRAVLEGVAFGLRDSFSLMQGAGLGVIRPVRVSGGGARSPLWRQILADVLGSELATVNSTEGAAYGAALLAGVGAGVSCFTPAPRAP